MVSQHKKTISIILTLDTTTYNWPCVSILSRCTPTQSMFALWDLWRMEVKSQVQQKLWPVANIAYTWYLPKNLQSVIAKDVTQFFDLYNWTCAYVYMSSKSSGKFFISSLSLLDLWFLKYLFLYVWSVIRSKHAKAKNPVFIYRQY